MNNSWPFSKSKRSQSCGEEKDLLCRSLQLRRQQWTINKLFWKLIRVHGERERKGNVETVEEGKEGRQENRAEWASRYIP